MTLIRPGPRRIFVLIALLLIAVSAASLLIGVVRSSLRLQYVDFDFVGPGKEVRDGLTPGTPGRGFLPDYAIRVRYKNGRRIQTYTTEPFLNASGGLILYMDLREAIPLADVREIALLEFDETTSGMKELTRAEFAQRELFSDRRTFTAGQYHFRIGNGGRELHVGLKSFAPTLPGLFSSLALAAGVFMPLGLYVSRPRKSEGKLISK